MVHVFVTYLPPLDVNELFLYYCSSTGRALASFSYCPWLGNSCDGFCGSLSIEWREAKWIGLVPKFYSVFITM